MEYVCPLTYPLSRLKDHVTFLANIMDGQKTQRKLTANYDLVGICCESTFARVIGQEYVFKTCRHGDGFIDFWVGRVGLDVKGSRRPGNLAVEPDKCLAHIFVLAKWHEDDPGVVRYLGFATRREVLAAKQGCLGTGTRLNHLISSRLLHPMSELESVLRMANSSDHYFNSLAEPADELPADCDIPVFTEL